VAYKYAIAINYNLECVPYAGSAIFFHCTTGGGTAGCVSVPESTMISILKNVHPGCLIVIASGNNIYNY
jgi:L,D-peptidoglycan transpeptidase YkuD (ErfK/YbiS/YcfS/YnhG family)